MSVSVTEFAFSIFALFPLPGAALGVPLRTVWRKNAFTPQKSDCTHSLLNG